jgi:hypothetical protein
MNTSDLVTAKPEVNIGSSRRGSIMTLSETPSKEQHENGTTYQTPQLESSPTVLSSVGLGMPGTHS